ncbi:hypothetical protein KIW84_056114 [Lathyrus oleraceus]|uniref:Uncharacterized protein n=1 Tax=Pisum sativum TaxID=3888 RepID=A0A9D4WYF6_PEA|nr:hypothetical protein KIW84_056114 [Pisum sativum]
MKRDSALARVATGAAVGGAIGGAVGAVYGTYDAIRYKLPGSSAGECLWVESGEANRAVDAIANMGCELKKVPGFLKIRHIGQTTLGSAAVFSLFLAAGTLIRSH